MNQLQIRGRVAHASGISAENRIAQDYERRGFALARRRWRGKAGEIDLIAQRGDEIIFVEVKKSCTIARAAERLSRRQMERIYASAAQFLGTQPLGQMTPSRFDVALVDAQGQFEIIENAFGAF
ncbi:MAG: YraN family protein [Heliomarina sp.]|uniref:YraN family protein n=1 Tax=Heliomarina sp. TaxID=2917556 RepID=UPI004059A4D6